MSIVPLVKVTVCGHLMDKARVLADLQEVGCLHLIPLAPAGAEAMERGPSADALEALKYLLSHPQRRRQSKDAAKFDAEAVKRRALEIQNRSRDLEDERDFLAVRIRDLEPWGDFHFYAERESGGFRLWFYVVPNHQMKDVEATELLWEAVGRDTEFTYVVVISEKPPEGMPVARIRTGAKPLSELQRRLDEVEDELEDLQAERASLTRWCELFAAGLDRLEDRQALLDAFQHTHDESQLFALQGWAPKERTRQLQEYGQTGTAALQIDEPSPQETPPTLFRNTPQSSPGEALVLFYTTPSYWLWDPSSAVLYSFAIFFAMILGDGGYALVLAAGLGLGWKKMGASADGQKVRLMLSYLIGASVVWGVLVGSYFGVSPPEGTLLAGLKILDVNDAGTMMKLSILIGGLHIAYANIRNALRYRASTAGLAPAGWAAIILGGLALWFGSEGIGPAAALENAGIGAMGIGALLVLGFTGAGESPGKRLLAGLMSFTNLSKAFGDILSYLRLFALGLASASLAVAFNDLAKQVYEGLPGAGLLLALLILVIGHTLNLVLAIASGVIHGLRLNVIEFFNWGIQGEGSTFRAFEKKEAAKWTR